MTHTYCGAMLQSRLWAGVSQVKAQDIVLEKICLEKYEIKINEYEGRLWNGGI